MVKQLSSFDVHFLVKELQSLVGARVDKIYNREEELYLQLYKSGHGKKSLRIVLNKAFFLANKKEAENEPSEFCMMLRRNLDGKTLKSINQLKPERIVKLVFASKEQERILYIEQFGKGNVILCDKSTILDSLVRQRFRDRAILPKKEYIFPSMKYNPFSMDKKALSQLLKESKRENLVTALATDLGLGGLYAEEVCLHSHTEKRRKPSDVKPQQISQLVEILEKIKNKKIKAMIVYSNGKAVDVTPFLFDFYSGKDSKGFSSFNEALDHYFTKEISVSEKQKSPYEQRIQELERIIKEQKETIETLAQKEQENKEKGELIYHKYALVKEILDEIHKAKDKHSWEEIKKKLKGHQIIKDVNIKEKKITIDLS